MALQAAGPPDADFGRRLRALRLAAGLTQGALADRFPVRRETVSQWESDRYLPSLEHVKKLDHFLGTNGELSKLAMQKNRLTLSAPPQTLSLLDIVKSQRKNLTATLIRDLNGDPVGWGRNFTSARATPLSTATAIRLLSIVGAPSVDPSLLGRSLIAMEEPSGGWQARAVSGRPEVTAFIAGALASVGAGGETDRLIDLAKEQSDDRAMDRTYVLTEITYSLAALGPDCELAQETVQRLLDRQTAEHGWTDKESSLPGVKARPSSAHTARAVIALHRYLENARNPQPKVQEAIDLAADWLIQHADLRVSNENLEPTTSTDQSQADLEIRHFTSALTIQALILSGRADQAAIDDAAIDLWGNYNSQLSLWLWKDSETPIWMQYEAIAALTLSAQLQFPTPIELDDEA